MADQHSEADSSRMSFGDHLEELRTCLIRALVGITLCGVICLLYGKTILSVIFQPLLVVQAYNGLPMELQALAPAAGFLAYLKIGMLSGLILAMPWVLFQIWHFVASGLYPHERRFVRGLLPASLFLFVLGVLFLYFIVLPIVLHFFITFNKSFSPPVVSGRGLYSWLLPPKHDAASADGPEAPIELPILDEDPAQPLPNQIWINGPERKLKVATRIEGGDAAGEKQPAQPPGPPAVEIWSVVLRADQDFSAVHSQFAIDFYISFVLMLALAFGIAFELPVVVFFLAKTGLVPVEVMASLRRYVLFGIVIAAAVMTPPDVISQLLLAVPMYGLFEIGLFVGRFVEKKEEQQAAASEE